MKRSRHRIFGAIWVGCAVALAGILPVATTAPAFAEDAPAYNEQASPIELPETIPSLDNFVAAESGTWTLTSGARIVTDAKVGKRAEMLSTELSAFLGQTVPAIVGVAPQSSDVSLVLDSTREDLGEEGFALDIGAKGLVITAKEDAGIFYGTRTVSQLLRQEWRGDAQLTLPAGSVVSVPQYEERGAILCACQLNISPEWINQFLDDLADLHINQVLMEMKVKSEVNPDTNTWSYYTKEDVKEFVAKADELNIDVIPEINSPGHMNIWLENSPQYQLREANGKYHPDQLNIANEDARNLLLGLIDEYDDVFTSDYWHMGADEFTMTGGYDLYPELTQYARDKFGPNATANDAFNAFINEVNDHLKAKGKTLRVFNDGVVRAAEQKIDTDVVVDYWLNKGAYTPQQFAQDGYKLMNTTQALYWSRANVYGVNTPNLYNSGWNVATFDGNQKIDPDYPGLLGARVSLWPDSALMTENEVKMQTRDSIAFLAQMTWSGERPWKQWEGDDGMGAAVNRVGYPVIRSEVPKALIPDGTYTLPSLNSVGKGPWKLTKTYDDYYQIKDASSGQCLTIDQTAKKHLGGVSEVGAKAALASCADPSVQYNNRKSVDLPHQKWQVRSMSMQLDGEKVPGVTLRNAATLQYLAVSDGTEQHVDIQGVSAPEVRQDPNLLANTFSAEGNHVAKDTVAQFPHDLVKNDKGEIQPKAIFAMAQQMGITTNVSELRDVNPAAPQNVTATLFANGSQNAPASTVKVAVSEGWNVAPAEVDIASIPMGRSADAIFAFQNTTATEGTATFTWEVAGETYVTEVALRGMKGPRLCGDGFENISTNSEETAAEGVVNGHIAAAFDVKEDGSANLDTFWHTRWSPKNDNFPFWVVFNPSKALDGNYMTTIEYAPRQNKVNGRIKSYEVYLSKEAKAGDEDWGDPVAEGELQSTTSWQAITMPPKTEGQYVKIVITDVWDEVAGREDSFASSAGFCVSTEIPAVELTAPQQPENPVVTGDEEPVVLPGAEVPQPVALALTASATQAEGKVGEALTPITLTVTASPTPSYLMNVENLPSGLNVLNGEISGTPTSAFDGDVAIGVQKGDKIEKLIIHLKISDAAGGDPNNPPAPSGGNGEQQSGESSSSDASNTAQHPGLQQTPNTGANVVGLVIAATVLLLTGAVIAIRRRKA